jgi:hypothetical protein
MSYPRTATEIYAAGDHMQPFLDYDAIVAATKGYLYTGTFVSPYRFVISNDGTYTHASTASQTIYGGPSGLGGASGSDSRDVMQAVADAMKAEGGGCALIRKAPSPYINDNYVYIDGNYIYFDAELLPKPTAQIFLTSLTG